MTLRVGQKNRKLTLGVVVVVVDELKPKTLDFSDIFCNLKGTKLTLEEWSINKKLNLGVGQQILK